MGYGDLFEAWLSSGQAPAVREKLRMVASLVPDSPEGAYLQSFREHAWECFAQLYDDVPAGADEYDSDAFSPSLEDEAAPHHPAPILFEPGLVGLDLVASPGWQDRAFVQAAYRDFLPTATLLAGPYMGSNFRKGHTFTWLPNHLMDGVEQVSPRSFLSALQKALSETRGQYAGHEYALHHEGIRRDVQKASETRVTEVSEDMPWVMSAIRPLAGHQVPIEQAKVEVLWQKVCLADSLRKLAERYEPQNDDDEIKVRTGPRYPEDPKLLIEELIGLGVMRRRRDGRIDLPDVYRIAFGVGRKGGVPRVAG